MKPLCKSNNKAKKQTIVTETVLKIKIQLTGNALLPVFTQNKQQIERKTI